MAIQLYDTKASRNLIRAEMQMLKHAEPIQVLGKFGAQKEQPLRKSDTVVFRRLQPFGSVSNGLPSITAANFALAEGTTPTSNTIDYTDVSVTVQHWGVLFKFSSKAELTYEDDIPEDMSKLTGETLAEVAELIAYSNVKAGSTVGYASSTGTAARTSVDSKISLSKLRLAARTLITNRSSRVTSTVKPGPDFGTSAVEPGYIVFMHSDVSADVRDLPGFIKKEEYGSSTKPVHERELGACEEFRFVQSPLFSPYTAGGDSVGSTGLKSVGASAVDVYPVIIMGADAFGNVSLKGKGYTGIRPTIIPSSQKSHANPLGMFGYVGADFWYNCVRLNENWMYRLEVGVTDL